MNTAPPPICTPTAQARVRHAARNGHAVAYKSPEQQANERTLDALLAPHTPNLPLRGSLGLFSIATLPMNRSASKRATEAMLEGKIGHTKKPDLDNLAKQLMDAMTRLQFDRLVCEKRYGMTGQLDIEIQKIGE